MDLFKGGFVSNEDIAATLRAHHAAVNATKSPQRAAAEEFARRNNMKWVGKAFAKVLQRHNMTGL